MRPVTPEKEAAARAAGSAAADAGRNCVPAHCSQYLSLIENFRVGDGAAHLAALWIEGFHSALAKLRTDAAARLAPGAAQ